MTNQSRYLYTKEFSEITGIPVSTVARLLREKAIKGEKKSGRWIIPESELNAHAVKDLTGSPGVAKSQTTNPAPVVSYSIAEFAQMTYLTEKGIANWLKTGRLKGHQDAAGEWRVDASNCEIDDIKRLLRGD